MPRFYNALYSVAHRDAIKRDEELDTISADDDDDSVHLASLNHRQTAPVGSVPQCMQP